MLAKVSFPIFVLLLSRTADSEDFLHEWVVTSWCEFFTTGIGYSFEEYFFCRKENSDIPSNGSQMRGVTIRIGLIEGGDLDFDCSSVVENGLVKSEDSYSQYLLTILQEILSFNVKLVRSTSWGFQERRNHTWKGLTGLLTTNATDLVGCHWTATQDLSRVVDFLVSTLETTESFVYLPQNLPLMEDVFVAAFSRKLWIYFLASIFLLIAAFRFSTQMHSRVRPDHEPWGWDEILLWAVAAVSQQSYSKHPRGSSCRTMFLIGYLIAYLFYTGFAAGITSLLALQSHLNQLTFHDVANKKLHLIVQRDECFLDFLEKIESEFSHNIHQGEGETLNEMFEKIKETNVLGFGSTVTLLHYLRKNMEPEERESYVVVAVPHSLRQKSFLVQKSFPYKQVFNYWLTRLRENGLLDLGKKRYLKTDEAANFQSTKWFSAGLGNVFSAVVFLSSGWIFSIFVLLLEIISKKKKKKNKNVR